MSKKNEGRFNIQFDLTDPEHRQVIDILDGKRPRGKASYVADAILHYENCTETPIIRATPAMDVKMIEAVVYRILSKKPPVGPAISSSGETSEPTAAEVRPSETPDDANVDAAIKALGADNIQAILGAVNSFRN